MQILVLKRTERDIVYIAEGTKGQVDSRVSGSEDRSVRII